ncbi:MAG: RNA methyltransferase [Defluviitaleaceae bacterium]|nr:RNA methyltransferase [Defluviitaleaceae bacterium]
MAVINSPTNFRVLQWAKLKQKIQRDKSKQFIAEGYHCLAEASKANCLLETISTESGAPFGVSHHQVSYDVLAKLSSMATPAKMLGICKMQPARSPGEKILLIDQVHHPGNLGTIIRNGVAFCVDTIVTHASVDIYNPKVVQASQGMVFHLNIMKKPLRDYITEIKAQGYQIIGTDVRDGMPLQKARAASKHALLLGSEGDGVGEDLLSLCDIKVHIPMHPLCESLNVGVAAGILLYGLRREC